MKTISIEQMKQRMLASLDRNPNIFCLRPGSIKQGIVVRSIKGDGVVSKVDLKRGIFEISWNKGTSINTHIDSFLINGLDKPDYRIEVIDAVL